MTRSVGLLTLLALLAGPAAGRARADETFDSNGVKINYSVKGKGAPVILIHGYLSSGWLNWDLPGITQALAKDYQVIWLDIPAHGRSGAPTKDEAYGLELVEHVVRLLDHLKIKQAHLVGYSMGGIITAKFLATHPDRALSGTLGGMGWLRDGSIEKKFFAAGGKDGKPLGVCFRSLAKLALTEAELKSIRAPVLVIFGENDFLKQGYVEPLKRARKDWPVIEVPDADHITCIIRPQFREEIARWLRKQAPREQVPLNSVAARTLASRHCRHHRHRQRIR